MTSVEDIRAKSAISGRNVGIYALFHMILADTDDAAEAQVRQIIDAADHGAISNILGERQPRYQYRWHIRSIESSTGSRRGKGKHGIHGYPSYIRIP
ncbi:MAG: hypothetical protein CM15mP92_2490 [Halieaceae bacterium]|nr:MAG: hypothetical protein CM15mP92_2490 [Halieaceae bacterium]